MARYWKETSEAVGNRKGAINREEMIDANRPVGLDDDGDVVLRGVAKPKY